MGYDQGPGVNQCYRVQFCYQPSFKKDVSDLILMKSLMVTKWAAFVVTFML